MLRCVIDEWFRNKDLSFWASRRIYSRTVQSGYAGRKLDASLSLPMTY
jgi:hypothetical protein